MAGETQAQWHGKATVELQGLTADQVWPSLADFCSLNKWFPNLDTCYQVEGELGQPGLVRYCAATTQPVSDSGDGTTISWLKEKLLMINPTERCLSYEVLENNVGFKSYVATMKVLPINNGDGQHGCRIDWSFVADPVEGWRLEDMNSFGNYCLRFMAEKIENAVLSS